jgi:hypothetical protein
MTPEECARFLLSDCQDPDLRAKADRENDAALAESLKDPALKAIWEANLQAMADRIADDALAYVLGEMNRKDDVGAVIEATREGEP